jgi:hypothetical protein
MMIDNRIYMGIIAFLLIVLMILSTTYIQNLNSNDLGIEVINARKEDLMNQQQELQKTIIEINTSLQTELIKQKLLNNQLTMLNDQSNNLSSSKQTLTQVVVNPLTKPTPPISISTTPPKTTRAS